MARVMDVRARQREAILAMLACSGDTECGEWKVLILDEPCRAVLAPLLSVNELRRAGVTLHCALEQPRDALDDAAAVYLCRPTEANASHIARDCAERKYGKAHVNWSTRVERRVLEHLARELASHDPVSPEHEIAPSALVASVWDRNVEFVALEPRLFSLGLARTFERLHGAASEREVAELVECIASGLFCVCATLSAVPVLRAPPGGAAEAVAKVLHAKLAEEWRRKRAALSGEASGAASRPLLVLLDRSVDLSTAARHTETYQALVDDVLEYKANRVVVDDEAGGKKTLELRHDEDEFFAKQAHRSFPDVIDASSEELSSLRAHEKALRARAGRDGAAGDGEQGAAAQASSRGLMDAVGELPVLLERKKQLEAHTCVLGAVMKKVIAREVPKYCEAEDLTRRVDKKLVLELLGAAAKGTTRDKLRLLLARSLADPTAFDEAELEQLLATLKQHADDASLADKASQTLALARRLRDAAAAGPSVAAAAAASDAPASAEDAAQEGTAAQFSRMMLAHAAKGATKLVDKAAKGVGQLLSGATNVVAPRVCAQLFDGRGASHEHFLYLDPKLSGKQSTPPANAEAPLDSLVFVVGGGCYTEHHALQNAFADTPRTVVYGATELLSPDAFLDQLIALADQQA